MTRKATTSKSSVAAVCRIATIQSAAGNDDAVLATHLRSGKLVGEDDPLRDRLAEWHKARRQRDAAAAIYRRFDGSRSLEPWRKPAAATTPSRPSCSPASRTQNPPRPVRPTPTHLQDHYCISITLGSAKEE